MRCCAAETSKNQRRHRGLTPPFPLVGFLFWGRSRSLLYLSSERTWSAPRRLRTRTIATATPPPPSPPFPLGWRIGLQSFATFWQFLVALLTLPMALTLAEAFSPHTMDTPFIMGVGGAMLYAIIKLF